MQGTMPSAGPKRCWQVADAFVHVKPCCSEDFAEPGGRLCFFEPNFWMRMDAMTQGDHLRLNGLKTGLHSRFGLHGLWSPSARRLDDQQPASADAWALGLERRSRSGLLYTDGPPPVNMPCVG